MTEAAAFLKESPSLSDAMLPGMAEELERAIEATGRDRAETQSTLGEYSGARFFSKNPASYQIVVRLLAEGLPVRTIERVMGLSHHLVEAIRAREAASMTTRDYSCLMAGRVRGVLMQAADELRARLEDPERRSEISTRDLIAAMDRLSSIERDMAGEPQSIQRVIQPVGVDGRIAALLRGMGDGVEDAEFEEVEKGGSNGLGREKTGAPESRARAGEDGNGGSRTDAGEVAGEPVENLADGGGTPSV